MVRLVAVANGVPYLLKQLGRRLGGLDCHSTPLDNKCQEALSYGCRPICLALPDAPPIWRGLSLESKAKGSRREPRAFVSNPYVLVITRKRDRQAIFFVVPFAIRGCSRQLSSKLKALALEAQLVAAFASGSELSPLVALACHQN